MWGCLWSVFATRGSQGQTICKTQMVVLLCIQPEYSSFKYAYFTGRVTCAYYQILAQSSNSIVPGTYDDWIILAMDSGREKGQYFDYKSALLHIFGCIYINCIFSDFFHNFFNFSLFSLRIRGGLHDDRRIKIAQPYPPKNGHVGLEPP